MPALDQTGRKRPLCYDSRRKKFILFDEIVSGKEKIIPLGSLSREDQKKLIIERWRVLPENTKVRAMSGPLLSRNDVIRAIERDDPFGIMTFEAEKTHVEDLLNEILMNMKKDSGQK